MAGDFLKDFYYRMEEKYYAFLDRLDKAIPVYKIVEPIDRVVPSFAIVLLIIILLLVFGGWFLIGLLTVKPQVTITLQVETSEGDLLGNATVKILGKSYITDSQGLAKLELERDLKVRYEASKNGYETKKGEFIADESKAVSIIMVEQAQSSSKIITIQDFYGSVITKQANFSFTCTSGATPNPPSATTSSGSVSVSAPSNCGTLVASVSVQGFEPVQSYSIVSNSQVIQLKELEAELSTIRARVLSEGAPAAGIRVTIFENRLGPLQEQTTNAAGIAEFKYPASSFQLKTIPTSEFGQQSTEEFTTQPGETVTKEISLERDIVTTLKVNVVEKNTSKKIEGASVTVRRGNNKIDTKKTDSNGSVSFTLNALDSEYFISADHDAYLAAEKKISILQEGDRTETLVLEKFDGSNAATLKVRVLDAETGKPVKTARVALYYGLDEDDKGGFLAPYPEQLSDINGIARFPRVKPGVAYYAVASRMGASGKSDTQRFDAKTADTTFYNVSLIVPSGTVKVTLTDEEGIPVQNAKVTLYDAVDNSVLGSDLTIADGTWTLPASSRYAKADKEVFVKVEKNALSPDEKEYAAVTTVAKPILPNAVTEFKITMQPKQLSGDFKLEFLGLFKKDRQVSSISEVATPVISAGQKYVARFQAIVPEGQTYTDSVIHVHVGKGEYGYGIMEKDSAVIKSVNMPLASNILKATKLDSANGFDEDASSVTDGDAKWVNIPVNYMSSGIYDVEVEVEIRDTALVGEQIGVYSWMLGDSENGRIYYPRVERAPKDDFYFEPPQKAVYQVGVTTLCDSEFCFNVNIIELLEGERGLGESVDESYNAKILKNYRLIFNISNNSKTTVHNDAELRIANDDKSINIKNYSITLPSGRTVQATLGASKLPNIPITNSQSENRFEKGAAITGELVFTPTLANNGILSFKIASSSDPSHTGLYSTVFQKDITIIVGAENQFNVEVLEPASQTLSAGVENTVTLKVKDAKTGLEVEDADVVVKDRFGNSLNSGRTSRLGEVTLTVASLLPKEEVTFTVSKPDYAPKSIKMSASDKLLKLTPESLSVNINATVESQKLAALKIENIAPFPLKITSLEYSGSSRNILDETAINNFLADQQGFDLSSESSKTINFGAFLTEEAIGIQEREQLAGTLIVRAGNYGYTWTFNVPVKTTVGFGADLDNEDCLAVSPLSWTTTTQGKAVSFEFEVQNNCSSNGQPVPISELAAKVDWESNQLGDFTISLYDDKIQGAVAAAQLRSGYFKKLIDIMPAEKSYKGVLAFNPAGGVNGVASAKIVLRAKNKTSENESKPQLLTQEIVASIMVINLKECISFSKEILSIQKVGGTSENSTNSGEASDSFTISNKQGCGQIKLSLDTEPTNTIQLSTTEVTLEDGGTSPAIMVIASKSTLPGQYAVRVWAQPKGQATPQEFTSLREKDKFIRVRVWDSGMCLQLDKYEFDVYKDPENKSTTGYDTAELTNYCVDKEASFKVDMKSFANAAKDGLKWGLLTALLGIIARGVDSALGSGTQGPEAGQQARNALVNELQAGAIPAADLGATAPRVKLTTAETKTALEATQAAKSETDKLVSSEDSKGSESSSASSTATGTKAFDAKAATNKSLDEQRIAINNKEEYASLDDLESEDYDPGLYNKYSAEYDSVPENYDKLSPQAKEAFSACLQAIETTGAGKSIASKAANATESKGAAIASAILPITGMATAASDLLSNQAAMIEYLTSHEFSKNPTTNTYSRQWTSTTSSASNVTYNVETQTFTAYYNGNLMAGSVITLDSQEVVNALENPNHTKALYDTVEAGFKKANEARQAKQAEQTTAARAAAATPASAIEFNSEAVNNALAENKNQLAELNSRYTEAAQNTDEAYLDFLEENATMDEWEKYIDEQGGWENLSEEDQANYWDDAAAWQDAQDKYEAAWYEEANLGLDIEDLENQQASLESAVESNKIAAEAAEDAEKAKSKANEALAEVQKKDKAIVDACPVDVADPTCDNLEGQTKTAVEAKQEAVAAEDAAAGALTKANAATDSALETASEKQANAVVSLSDAKDAVEGAKQCVSSMAPLCQAGLTGIPYTAECEILKKKASLLIQNANAKTLAAASQAQKASAACTTAVSKETAAAAKVEESYAEVSAINTSRMTPVTRQLMASAKSNLSDAMCQQTGKGCWRIATNISTIEKSSAGTLNEVDVGTRALQTQIEEAGASVQADQMSAAVTTLNAVSKEIDSQKKTAEEEQEDLKDAEERSKKADTSVNNAYNQVKSSNTIINNPKDDSTGTRNMSTNLSPQSSASSSSCPNGICPAGQAGQQGSQGSQQGFLGSLVSSQPAQNGGLFSNMGLLSFLTPGAGNFAGGILGGSPITQGLGVFLAKTMYNMSQQDTISFTTTQKDLEVTGFEMYKPKGEEIADDAQISVEQIGNYTITDNRIGSKLSNETMGLRFTNQNPKKYGTFYKTLEVNAIRHYYESKTYNIEEVPLRDNKKSFLSKFLSMPSESDIDVTEIDLDEEDGSPKDASQFFMLQFNNINPEDIVTDTTPTVDVDCVNYLPPGVTGTTGDQAFDEGGAPRLLLDWSWPVIEKDSCDEGNPNYAFCDGVQFSIEVLRKVQTIREFLSENELECPSAASGIGEKTYVIADESIGIARIYSDVVASSGTADVNVQITIENKIPSKVDTRLRVVVTNSNTLQSLPECVKDLNVISKAEVGCEFKGLSKAESTAYTVVAAIEPSCGTSCDKISADNTIESSFIVGRDGSSVLQICPTAPPYDEVYNTSRLEEFINATEKAGKPVTYPEGMSKAEFLKNLKFNAYLIADRYSPDLHSDFDDYYRNIAFLQTPAWYKGEGEDLGLGEIFKDYSIFKFGPKYGEIDDIGFRLERPGLYNVSIEIGFNNTDWKFFENGQADVEAFVRLNKAPTEPASLSPFYYLPFDGRVGVDSGNGRVNYGMNYEQQFEGAPVQLTTGLEGVALSGGASWIPYFENATLKTDKVSDFKKLNVDDRGEILTVSQSKLSFSPSYATPVIWKISNKSGEACSSYSFGAGSLTYAGQESNPWWGVGENCIDFYDSVMIEAYQNGVFDKSTSTTGSWGTICGSTSYTAYGMEWPDEQQAFGNVFLKSIFYTPQGTSNVINTEISNETAEFWTKAASGTTNIPLNGVGASAENIADVKRIIGLVKERQVCVSGTETEQKFWWNPTAVINEIADLETKAEGQCIKG